MADRERGGDLEIDEDLAFQRRTWKVERVAWIVMGTILLLGLLGLLGPGPLSTTTAGTVGSSFWLEYDRFVRYEAASILCVRLTPQTAAGHDLRLWIDRKYLEAVQVEYITPHPQSVQTTPDKLIYTFRVGGKGEAAMVVFPTTIRKRGTLEGRMGIEGGPSVRFRQFAYP